MVKRALAINVPVVNIKWLSDIILGAQVDLLNPHSCVYQQFDLHDPYSVTYNMVSHLMGTVFIDYKINLCIKLTN